jgi:hypothetical protein
MTYGEAKEKLSARVRVAHESTWSPTPARKECERVAEALENVANLLAASAEAPRIEAAHKERGEPGTAIGEDGWPVAEEDHFEWHNYKSIKWIIRDLAKSARVAAEEMPDPRQKHALRHAAMGLLQLRGWHDMPNATAYKDGEVVIELEYIAQRAGIMLSRETYLKALKEAIGQFDKNSLPREFAYLIK